MTTSAIKRHLPSAWPGAGAAPVAVPWWVHVVWVLALLATDALQLFTFRQSQLVWPTAEQVLVRVVLYNVLASAVFYANWVVLIPHTLARGRLDQYTLGVLGLLLSYVPLRAGGGMLMQSLTSVEGRGPHNWVGHVVPYLIFGLIIIFFSSGLKVTGDYLQEQRNRRELERQQLLTELSLLKMQVNPHFLFNTLNNIYSLARQKSDRTPEAVLRLSEIMRYMLYESSADTVPLGKELAHLRSFLDLQRLRLPGDATEAIFLDTAELGTDPQYPIAPMLLMPVVENAFKHGDLSVRPRAVDMRLRLDAVGALHFSVLNYLSPGGGPSLDQPGGVGLANLRRRLELLYPSRYLLTVDKGAAHYRVDLTLLPG